MRRVPLLDGGSDPIGVALATGAGHLIVDLEPLVVMWDSPTSRLNSHLAVVVDQVAGRATLTIATNSRQRPSNPVTGLTFRRRAGKPWRVGWARPMATDAAVVGDIVWTDGLLAWRIGAPFVLVTDQLMDPPLWPRVQRWTGRLLLKFLFVEGDGDNRQ